MEGILKKHKHLRQRSHFGDNNDRKRNANVEPRKGSNNGREKERKRKV